MSVTDLSSGSNIGYDMVIAAMHHGTVLPCPGSTVMRERCRRACWIDVHSLVVSARGVYVALITADSNSIRGVDGSDWGLSIVHERQSQIMIPFLPVAVLAFSR